MPSRVIATVGASAKLGPSLVPPSLAAESAQGWPSVVDPSEGLESGREVCVGSSNCDPSINVGDASIHEKHRLA